MPRSEGGELCQLSPVGVLLILSDLAAPPRPRPALRASPSLRGPSRARPVPWSAPGPGSPVMPRSEAADLASSPVPSVCSPYRVISLHLRALVLPSPSCAIPSLRGPSRACPVPTLAALGPGSPVIPRSVGGRSLQPPACYARRCPRFYLAISVCFASFLFLFCVFFPIMLLP